MTTMEITPLNLSRKKDDFVVCKQRYFLEKGKQSIICFVEGKYDSDYYYDKFRNQLGEDFVIIPCQRKKNVLKAYDCFYENDHQRVKMGFFVDRDFDPQVGNPNIFETDRYAIENYYCSEQVLERVLRYAFKVDDEDTINSAKVYFHEQFLQFHSVVEEFNAFYSLIKQKEKTNNVCYNVCLDTRFPENLADVEINKFDKRYNLQILLEKYSLDKSLISQKELDNEVTRLNTVSPFYAFRGKYEIEFMYKILFKLVNDANSKKVTDCIIKQKVSANLNNKSFMSDYSQYADIASGLKEYLQILAS